MFNFIHIYNVILLSFCVGMGTSALLCPGAYNAVKTALITRIVMNFHGLKCI